MEPSGKHTELVSLYDKAKPHCPLTAGSQAISVSAGMCLYVCIHNVDRNAGSLHR